MDIYTLCSFLIFVLVLFRVLVSIVKEMTVVGREDLLKSYIEVTEKNHDTVSPPPSFSLPLLSSIHSQLQ